MLFILLNMLSRNTNIVSYLIGEQVNVIEFYYEGGNKLLCRSFFCVFFCLEQLEGSESTVILFFQDCNV